MKIRVAPQRRGDDVVWLIQMPSPNTAGEWVTKHTLDSYDDALAHMRIRNNRNQHQVEWVKLDEPAPEPEEEAGDAPEWTLTMSPEEYLSRYPEGPNADLAREVVGG